MQGIDTHAHVFSATAPAVAGARYRPSYAARLAAWRALWRPAGITHGVLIQPSFFGTDNTEMLATIASDRARLRGVAVVDSSVSDAQLAHHDAGGVRGIRLNLRGVGDFSAYTTHGWKSLFERVHDLRWHVEVFLDAGALPRLLPAFLNTRVEVVLDHFGSPGETREAVEATFTAAKELAEKRALWVKLSAPYRLAEGGDPVRLAKRWIDLVGPTNVVWGSDWPWTQNERGKDYLRQRESLDRWVGANASASILWDNAARLYAFG
jgi:predicted TIM-barrel fold metal-dependent hydrolase